MKRSKHTLSHYRMVTANMGELFPIACIPVLPGDTVQMNTNALVRVSPLNTPVMHPTSVRIHHFFVPNRIVWDGWEDFITGGPDGSDASTIPVATQNTDKRNILSYLGVPPIALEVNGLPLFAANKIFNEYYRDQDLMQERVEGDRSTMYCSWEKDYFTTARPWTQKGPEVGLPVGSAAPVVMRGEDLPNASLPTIKGQNSGQWHHLEESGAPGGLTGLQDTPAPTGDALALYADLSDASAINVNDFRAAFAIQRYQEARARYGSRFTEYLRYLGITPSDARLQRPEYLGGGTTRLQFSEVLQTAEATSGGDRDGFSVGDMYGHGIAGARTNRFRKFFEEHGYIITMMSIRPKSMYLNGVPREFLKTTKEDYFQKELANLGQQEVWEAELYSEPEKNVFGYQDRYHEYRYQPSQVSNDFRDLLNAYHMGRDLAPNPVLNQDFLECNPTDRIFQVGRDVGDTLWIMANHHVVARRLVPKRANPRII